MKFEIEQAMPWFFNRYVFRKTKEPCPELYKFDQGATSSPSHSLTEKHDLETGTSTKHEL